MSLIFFLLKYFDSRYDMGRMMKVYDYIMNNNQLNIPEYSGYQTAGFQKKNFSQNIYLNKDYLLRKNQERKCYNRNTEISREGLEKRIMNRAIKNIMKDIRERNDKKIEKSFARKDKSRRWKKRHHQNT